MGITMPEIERRPAQAASLFFEHKEGIHALATRNLQKPDLLRNAEQESVSLSTQE
jgi:hypothetical protein